MPSPTPMTAQDIFTTSATHLLAQGEQSTNHMGECLYHGPRGRKCAIGIFIPLERYSRTLEGSGVETLPAGILPSEFSPHRDLLQRLQQCHDCFAPDEWPKALRKIAYDFDLTLPTPGATTP